MPKSKKRFLVFLGSMLAVFSGLAMVLQSKTELISVSNTVNGKDLPIYSVDTQEKKVALSFDAAWGNDDTKTILEILKKHHVHVTFFMTGGWVSSYPEDVKAIFEAGHDLGNHSENHKNMSQLSEEEIREEVMSVHEKVKELTGYEMFLFRPPYGDYDNPVIRQVTACGYYPVQWSIDSLDWKDYGAEDIIKRVCGSENLKGGAIILCHNGAKYTPQALDQLLTNLEQMGYRVVPVSELIYRENYHLDANGMQISDSGKSDS